MKHHCFAFNCTKSTQKQKNVEKYQKVANVRFFHTLRKIEMSIMLRDCQNENDVCDGLQPVVCTVQMLQGTPEYVQFISVEVLAQLN